MSTSKLSFSEFDYTNDESWLAAANQQLKGENPFEKLSWNTPFSNDSLAPYYGKSDDKDLQYLRNFFDEIEDHDWEQYRKLEVEDVKEANKKALESLNIGVEGILFHLSHQVDLNALTKGIDKKYCKVSFLVDYSESNHQSYSAYTSGFTAVANRSLFSVSSADSGVIQDSAEALHKYSVSSIEKNPIIVTRINADFFHEMAKIRGLRYLFDRVANSKNWNLRPENIHIHCEPLQEKKMDENLFQQSSAGLAGVLGGTNSLSLMPTENFERASINIGRLLKYESKLGEYKNYVSGSYFVDFLTDLFIKNVWSEFQNLSEA